MLCWHKTTKMYRTEPIFEKTESSVTQFFKNRLSFIDFRWHKSIACHVIKKHFMLYLTLPKISKCMCKSTHFLQY